MIWFIAAVGDSTVVVDFGDNLTSIILALIAGIPAIIAAFYAYKSNRSTEQGNQVIQKALNIEPQKPDEDA